MEITKEMILSIHNSENPKQEIEKLFPEFFLPEFKVGDKVVWEYTSAISDKLLIISHFNENIVYFSNSPNYAWKSQIRHATPEEIKQAEWKPGEVYYVNILDAIRVASQEVGYFYTDGFLNGKSAKFNNYTLYSEWRKQK